MLKIAAGLALFAAVLCGLSEYWFWMIGSIIVAVGCWWLDKKFWNEKECFMSKNNPLKNSKPDEFKKRKMREIKSYHKTRNHHSICRVNSSPRGRRGRTKQTGSD